MDSPHPLAPKPWKLVLRVVWVAIRLTLVFYLGYEGAVFFYQGF
jgi:hypothetical protein